MVNGQQQSPEPTVPTATLRRDHELIRSGKDAAVTRSFLVRAARRRFATEGYRAATVRRIAADAGVNVALINRYFGSKEGLFEACLQRSVEELRSDQGDPTDLDQLISRLAAHVVDEPDGDDPLQLMLLLRSSGDEQADRIRRRTLESYTERLALIAGWRADDPLTEPLLLRAQIAIATMLGLVMLRTAVGVQPLTSAGAEALSEPFRQVLRVLLAGTDAAQSESS